MSHNEAPADLAPPHPSFVPFPSPALTDSPRASLSPQSGTSTPTPDANSISPPPRLLTRQHESTRSIFSFLSASSRPTSTVGEDTAPASPFASAQTLASVKSYRTTSSNSPLYMFKNPTTTAKELPFEQVELSDEDFATFVKLAGEQQTLSAPGTIRKSITRTLYVLMILAVIYFVFVGLPLWEGGVLWFYRVYSTEFHKNGVWGMVGIILGAYASSVIPQLLCTFEREEPGVDPEKPRDASECCVVIPCYKSAETLKSTLPACLAIFGPEQIFVVANGNSPTPLDDTAEVCAQYGVKHVWVPVGSKITAEFVGVSLASQYKYCMLIDDDVLLPANLPLPTHKFSDEKVACVGYTIKSVGSNSSRGTIIQQVQDIEYKIAGLAKVFQSNWGSVIFPHGAVALWRRDVLEKLFHAHPGYHISEDWYLGHTARSAGYRIAMSSQLFVETETPPRLFPAIFSKKGGSRGGYGEMSIYKQRFFRWNFFFLFRLWSNSIYIFFHWRLTWRELVTKFFLLSEMYDTLLLLLGPVVLPITIVANWWFTLLVAACLLGVNFLLVCWFNAVHLWLLRRGRKTNERVAWKVFPVYIVVKFILVFMNIGSVYWSLYEYAFFFTRRQLRVTESVSAWQIIRENRRRADF